MRHRSLATTIAAGILLAPATWAATCTTTPWPAMSGVPALTDFPPGYLYLGQYEGLLYDGGNDVPADHDAAGRTLAQEIVPRDASGAACTSGPGCKIVFLAIGFSNTTIEFCGGQGIGGDPEAPAATQCPLPTAHPPYIQAESFIAKALADPQVNHATVVLVDGAQGGKTWPDWDPTVSGTAQYDRVRDQILVPSGLSPNQVQSVWLKDGNADPSVSLATGGPGNPPDALLAERSLGNVLRAIRAQYPNVAQVFISPRIYGGYANTASPPNLLNPEPYAFEQGFSIKWVIQAQIAQARGGAPDPDAGDLGYASGPAPWIAWGPYLWANATTPRSDGLVWLNSDVRGPTSDGQGVNECTHPSIYGEDKVSSLLLAFMKSSPYTGWFLGGAAPCTIDDGSLRVGADKRAISWSASAPAGPFDFARGNLITVRSASGSFAGAACRNDLTTAATDDPAAPPLGVVAYYLARCDGGTWNDGTQVVDRDATLTACP